MFDGLAESVILFTTLSIFLVRILVIVVQIVVLYNFPASGLISLSF